MPFYVVLDTCVLLPMPLRDTLLSAAAEELYVPKWAGRSLDSVARLLVEEFGHPARSTERLIAIMRENFEDAEVSAEHIAALEPAMTNAPADRYVLAAAVASGSEVIVTDNLTDFQAEDCNPHGVEAISPDEFLQDLLAHDDRAMLAALAAQAARTKRPPLSVQDVLERLERASPGVPGFASAARAAGAE